MVLHFLHAVSNHKGAGWAKVHAFTFGTRLTNITRHLRTKDVDAALASAGAEAQDWEGERGSVVAFIALIMIGPAVSWTGGGCFAYHRWA